MIHVYARGVPYSYLNNFRIVKSIAGKIRLERVEEDEWINRHVPGDRREVFETDPDKIQPYRFKAEAYGVLHEACEAYLTG